MHSELAKIEKNLIMYMVFNRKNKLVGFFFVLKRQSFMDYWSALDMPL